jgi:hypothetical protein
MGGIIQESRAALSRYTRAASSESAFDGRILDGAVHSLDLAIIRYEIIGASVSGCFRKGTGDMVSPSGTRGAGSTKMRAGRR